jgi:aryl-alcohol dehydrogenase-like predicted oxidoreductase
LIYGKPMKPRLLADMPRVGLGGEGVLRTHGRDAEAAAVIHAAIDAGIRYFDCARAYDGSEEYHGAVWPRVDRSRAFICSKSASRSAAGARRDLKNTLANMKVEYLDLWQIHDVRTDDELAAIARPGGALEAFLEARDAGLVKNIGVTGHHDPNVLLRAVKELPVSTVLLPVNVVESVIGGFLDRVLPEAHARGISVIGMKVMGGGMFARAGLSPTTLLRWALRSPADVLIIGCSSPAEVQTNVATTTPLNDDEARALEDRVRRSAQQLAYYRGVI